MKLIATLFKYDRINDILSLADGIVIGNKQFGTRLTHSFDLTEIISLLKLAKTLDKSVFLMANQMMDDHQLEDFLVFIKKLPCDLLSGIIVSDIGAVMTLKKINLSHLAIYHPETLLTNHFDFNFLNHLHIKGAFVAKEIALEDIITIGKHKAYDLFLTGHGHLNMFYSKRHLIENYTKYASIENHYTYQQDLKIIESERPLEPYPVLEDDAGTHVFRHHVLSSYDILDQLKPYVDYLVIDSLFKHDDYTVDILSLYKNQSKLTTTDIKKKYQEAWDSGFYYKKTIYKR